MYKTEILKVKNKDSVSLSLSLFFMFYQLIWRYILRYCPGVIPVSKLIDMLVYNANKKYLQAFKRLLKK